MTYFGYRRVLPHFRRSRTRWPTTTSYDLCVGAEEHSTLSHAHSVLSSIRRCHLGAANSGNTGKSRAVMAIDASEIVGRLSTPERLWKRPEVLLLPSPVPPRQWNLGVVLSCDSCGSPDRRTARPKQRVAALRRNRPRAPYRSGKISSQTIRRRIRYHYRGNAYGSTLRLTLGCLLSEHVGIRLCRVGTKNRKTFGNGESKLSE
jgi:hypothetical protein